MEITLTLALPRDKITVPVARRICTDALRDLGVDDDCRNDVELALTEACTNVLDHVAEGDDYKVSISLDDRLCSIEVIDTGRGFDSAMLEGLIAEPTAEQGRGIQIMRAVVDRVLFTSRPEDGTVCHLEKELVWSEASPLRPLADDLPVRQQG
jgi:serine/threonine-protein kinase RsbW